MNPQEAAVAKPEIVWQGKIDDRLYQIVVWHGDDVKHRSVHVETQVDGNWVRAQLAENIERAFGEAVLHWNSIGLFEPLR